MVDNIYKNHLLHYEHAVFYASNNKSNGVAKTIDNMYHVVKDRIQDQANDVKHIKMICMYYGSVYQRGSPPILMIMLPAWVRKAF